MRKLSIIIPVYNERKFIATVLERVAKTSLPGWSRELIVVNDGSTDRTLEELRALKADYDFKLIDIKKNRGKGAALRLAITETTGELVLVQDADLEYSPKDWPCLLAPFSDPKTDAVYGSRNLIPERQGYRRCVWGVRFLTRIINLLFGSNLTDSYTCYKCFRASVLRTLSLGRDGFDIEAEITVELLKRGYSIREVPIHYQPRQYAEGKKIRLKDGLLGLKTILVGYFRRR